MKTELNKFITDIPDFPKPGILFKDISHLQRYKHQEMITALLALISPEELAQIDVFIGLEARGFALASAMADRTGKGFVMVRKEGTKFPNIAGRMIYDLEYGKGSAIVMQAGEGNAFIVDDVLATGGTLKAACELATEVGYHVKGMATFINLAFLNSFEWQGMKCRSVLHYSDNGLLQE